MKVAMSNLGESYEYGRCVQKDLKTAIRWYQKAAEQDDEDAKQALKRLNIIRNSTGG